jgi:hypothetical protein
MKGDDSYHSRPRRPGKGRGGRSPAPALLRERPPARSIVGAMEFLNFLLILWTAWLLWRRPERERLAFRLLVISCLLMALLFFVGTHGGLVPGVNI